MKRDCDWEGTRDFCCAILNNLDAGPYITLYILLGVKYCIFLKTKIQYFMYDELVFT